MFVPRQMMMRAGHYLLLGAATKRPTTEATRSMESRWSRYRHAEAV